MVVGFDVISDFLLKLSPVDAPVVTLYSVFVKSLPVLYEEVVLRAGVVLFKLSLEYASELVVIDVP